MAPRRQTSVVEIEPPRRSTRATRGRNSRREDPDRVQKPSQSPKNNRTGRARQPRTRLPAANRSVPNRQANRVRFADQETPTRSSSIQQRVVREVEEVEQVNVQVITSSSLPTSPRPEHLEFPSQDNDLDVSNLVERLERSSPISSPAHRQSSPPEPITVYPLRVDYSVTVDGKTYRMPDSATTRDQFSSFSPKQVVDEVAAKPVLEIGDKEWKITDVMATWKVQLGPNKYTAHQGMNLDSIDCIEIIRLMDSCDRFFGDNSPKSRLLALTIDVKLACSPPTQAATASLTVVAPGSSVIGTPLSSRRTRTHDLVEQVDARRSTPQPGRYRNLHEQRLEVLRSRADFEKEICRMWRCDSPRCLNNGGFCFVHPIEPSLHYKIHPNQMETWANDCEAARATPSQPPQRLLSDWQQRQLAVGAQDNNGGRGRGGTSSRRHGEDRLERLGEIVSQLAGHQMEMGLNNAITTMVTDLARQQDLRLSKQEQSYLRQAGVLERLPTASHQAAARPRSPQSAPPSSPVAPNERGLGMTKQFFDWWIAITTDHDEKLLVEKAKDVAVGQGWGLDVLRRVGDSDSSLYREACDKGIASGIALRLRDEIRRFKQVYRAGVV